MIDFDAMVNKGIISQETREKIQTYMDEHKPEGEAPQAAIEEQTPTDTPTDVPDLLSEMLNAGIITQAEYDAIHAAE